MTFSILSFAFLVVVWSVERAEWVSPGLTLKIPLLIALLVGFVFAHLNLPSVLLHLGSAVPGLGIVLWRGLYILPDSDIAGRFESLTVGLSSWVKAVGTGELSDGVLPFALILLSLTWLVGYVSSWSVFRNGNGWVVLFVGVSVLLLNLSQLPEHNYWLLLPFIFAILGLVAYLNLLKRQQRFRDFGINKTGKGVIVILTPLILAGMVLVFAWHVPKVVGADFNGIINQSAPQLREEGGELWDRLFSGVRPTSFLFSGKDNLRFRGTPSLGDTVLFLINANEPYFWRERSFDTYTSRGWRNGSVVERDLSTTSDGKATNFVMKTEVLHRVKAKVRTDIVLTTGEPLHVSTPALAHFSPSSIYDIDLSQPVISSNLPADIASFFQDIQSSHGQALTVDELNDVTLPDIEILSVREREGRVLGVIVTRRQGNGDDIVAVLNRKFLSPEQGYTVVSSVSIADPAFLRLAGEEYPSWVKERYLQLPFQIPSRVSSLAREVAGEEGNSYDRVRAIKDYLHQIPYDVNVSAPPRYSDAVDYFLFSSRIGYCEYYASAMAVMLRSLGVPSRLVIGFTPGEWNPEKRLFIVRERNYHAWTEVYFPDYGWVAFDPTPPGANYNDIAGANIFDAPRPNLEEAGIGYSSDDDMDDDLDDFLGDAGNGIAESDGTPSMLLKDWRQGVLFFVLALGLLVSMFLAQFGYRLWKRLRDLDYPGRVYAQMCWLASWGGLGPKDELTPREYSFWLSRELPFHAAAIERISEVYGAARYGRGQQMNQAVRQEVDGLWRGLRRSLVHLALFRRLRVLHW